MTLPADSPKPAPPVGRRDFLKVGAATAASMSLGTAAGAGASPPAVDRPAASSPATVRPVQDQGPPRLPPNAVDPRTVEVETWQEPWVWRPASWPDDALELNAVQYQNPGQSPSPGNPYPSLFSYGGVSPGPTIRARGDESVRVTLRNHLGRNNQLTPVGPYPDPLDIVPADYEAVCRLVAERDGLDPADPPDCDTFINPEEAKQIIPGRFVPGYEVVDHANGTRTARATNLHTHGLHVRPESNPDGTMSDNVLLRVIPRGDWDARQQSDNAAVHQLRAHERVARVDYRFDLGAGRHGGATPHPHPPGTHWYHPHSHGSTHDQVSSGMAGFFIVEGDVDDAINLALTGEPRPVPHERTGRWDYRERLILIQRVFVNSIDLDAGPRERQLRFPPGTAVNGIMPASVMTMRPGAVERWRVLNASVDGSGLKRFMVLDGEFAHVGGRLWRVVRTDAGAASGAAAGAGQGGGGAATGGGAGTGGGGGRAGAAQAGVRLEPVARQEIEDAKLPLHLLAFDGITLVSVEGREPRHGIRDLSTRGAGTTSPLNRQPDPGEDETRALLRNIEDCYRDGDSLRRWYVRPNEVYMTNANRADVFFRAPLDSEGRVFTVFALEENLHTDNFQQRLQIHVRDGEPDFNKPPQDVVVAYIHVRGDPVEGGEFDVKSLDAVLPPVPPFLRPVEPAELRVDGAEARARGVPAGSHRTRTLSYSGYGGADFPSIPVPDTFVSGHPELRGLTWSEHDGIPVMLPNYLTTMGINGALDLSVDPEPGAARKFSATDPVNPRVLLGSAEEWVLYNNSLTLWAHTDRERFPQPGAYGLHYRSFPLLRAEGQSRFAADPEFQITAKGSDHPFHIHINPMWVIRIDVPDENGQLHNLLDEPRWMDTVPIPRNGGRVVFRTRFLDFAGRWVHHCHILMHEDMGMMQAVDCIEDATRTNWRPRATVASHAMPAAQVDAIYPRPSLELMYRQNVTFLDESPGAEQRYPGFEVQVPEEP